MEVIFEIEYRTEWGQPLVWCSGERRIAMEYRSDGVWRCRTTLAAGDVEYGYEVEADGRTIRREWRPHRQVIPQRPKHRCFGSSFQSRFHREQCRFFPPP